MKLKPPPKPFKILVTFEKGSLTVRSNVLFSGNRNAFENAKKHAENHPELGCSGAVLGFERV
jgi:hypothetical protein